MSDLVKKANSYISFMRRGISDTFDNVSARFQTAYNKAMFALCLFTVWGVLEAAASGPTMIVDSYVYDGSFMYVVTNTTSTQNPDYEMNKFILPAGSNQGVYNAIGPEDWNFSINLDDTTFSTITAPILPNGDYGVFELYSNIFDVTQRDTTAYTRFEEPFNPVSVDVPVNEKTLDADLNDDGIVNLVDFSLLAGNWGKEVNNPVTELTYYEAESGGVRVISTTEYDPENNLRIFYWDVFNNSGDTLFNNIFSGEQYVGGYGVNQSWLTEIFDSPVQNEDFIRFYDSYLGSGFNEQFISGSDWTPTWGIAPAKFESVGGNTFYVDTLIPMVATKSAGLLGDINPDGSVDWIDLGELCDQWLSTEKWYAPQ